MLHRNLVGCLSDRIETVMEKVKLKGVLILLIEKVNVKKSAKIGWAPT